MIEREPYRSEFHHATDYMPNLFKEVFEMCNTFSLRFKELDQRIVSSIYASNTEFQFQLRSPVDYMLQRDFTLLFWDILDLPNEDGYVVESSRSSSNSGMQYYLTIKPRVHAKTEYIVSVLQGNSKLRFIYVFNKSNGLSRSAEAPPIVKSNVTFENLPKNPQESKFKCNFSISRNCQISEVLDRINHKILSNPKIYKCLVSGSSSIRELLIIKNGGNIVACDWPLSGEDGENTLSQRDVKTVSSLNFIRCLKRLIEGNQAGVNGQKCIIVNTSSDTFFDVQSRVAGKSSAGGMKLPLAQGLNKEIQICAIAPGLYIMNVPFLRRFGRRHQYARLARSITENFVKRLP